MFSGYWFERAAARNDRGMSTKLVDGRWQDRPCRIKGYSWRGRREQDAAHKRRVRAAAVRRRHAPARRA